MQNLMVKNKYNQHLFPSTAPQSTPQSTTAQPQAPGGGIAGQVNGQWSPEEQMNKWQLPFQAPQRIDTVDELGNLAPQHALDVTSRRPDTPWFMNEQNKINQAYANNRNQLLQDNMNQTASAWNRMAMTGGIDGGARERIAREANRNLMNANANLANQRQMSVWDARQKDFTNQVNADKWNLGNQLGQIDKSFNADWRVFDTMAGAYGAEQTAQAQGKTPRRGILESAWHTVTNPGESLKSLWGG